GRALSADFTAQGWRNMLGFADAPLFSPQQAGAQLANLARQYDFSLFEYWASDYAGHKQDMAWALDQLQTFDGVLAGLLQQWDDDGLILITSDHGNLEDLSTRRHTPRCGTSPVAGCTTLAGGLQPANERADRHCPSHPPPFRHSRGFVKIHCPHETKRTKT
ncbi:MAG: alkaline phosphatase family protein, partial [Anaerolineae bacterium]